MLIRQAGCLKVNSLDSLGRSLPGLKTGAVFCAMETSQRVTVLEGGGAELIRVTPSEKGGLRESCLRGKRIAVGLYMFSQKGGGLAVVLTVTPQHLRHYEYK